MATERRNYALEPGGPTRVELRFDEPCSNLCVYFDGVAVAALPDGASLAAEPTFRLGDGSILRLSADPQGTVPVKLSRDGQRLLFSLPVEQRVTTVARWVYALALVTVGLSVLALTRKSPYLQVSLRMGWFTFAEGCLFGLLGFLTSQRSKASLLLVIAMVTFDGLSAAVHAVGLVDDTPIWPIPVRLILLLPLTRGLASLSERETDVAEVSSLDSVAAP